MWQLTGRRALKGYYTDAFTTPEVAAGPVQEGQEYPLQPLEQVL
jgi:hypothetical protein